MPICECVDNSKFGKYIATRTFFRHKAKHMQKKYDELLAEVEESRLLLEQSLDEENSVIDDEDPMGRVSVSSQHDGKFNSCLVCIWSGCIRRC